ncbi:MAG: 6-aminohexanoate hydrolase, partial [Comamonadaceae bacterium]
MRHLISSLLAAGTLCVAAAQAQPALPPPEATDPVKLGLMAGFPPAPDKTVRLANLLKYPNARWGFHHLRELGPTASIWRGAGTASALPVAARDLGAVAFRDEQGATTTLADWQRNTYTDGLLVLHRGRVIYEQVYAGMALHEPHALWS